MKNSKLYWSCCFFKEAVFNILKYCRSSRTQQTIVCNICIPDSPWSLFQVTFWDWMFREGSEDSMKDWIASGNHRTSKNILYCGRWDDDSVISSSKATLWSVSGESVIIERVQSRLCQVLQNFRLLSTYNKGRLFKMHSYNVNQSSLLSLRFSLS